MRPAEMSLWISSIEPSRMSPIAGARMENCYAGSFE
jgi:hypothetical protein